MYKKTLSIDLTDLGVSPDSAQMEVWDPMFVFIQQLPLPPERRDHESIAEWITRCNRDAVPDADVRWVFEPRFSRATGQRAYTGDPSCGRYFELAMRVRVFMFHYSNNTHSIIRII